MMGFMSSMSYYQTTFDTGGTFNVGLLAIVVLAILLIFLELTQPILRRKTFSVLGKLTLRLSTVTWILFFIFLGVTYTRIALVLVS